MDFVCDNVNQRFAPSVLGWQALHGRHNLPWQRSRDPYRVWVSEVMLQQTQVATVLAFYERFMERFASVADLAAASEDDVMGLWSGLGYYSRARNLHRCARVVVQQHGGEFPRTVKQLSELPGIGRSTAAAIAAFCFNQREAILDANVKRVLTRVLGFQGDLSLAAQERTLWQLATSLLPEQLNDMPAYTQGLMDLGATICQAQKTACSMCPVHDLCRARQEGQPENYPVKTRKVLRKQRTNIWLWLSWGAQIWLVQRPAPGVWARLWSLPELDDSQSLVGLSHSWPGEAEFLTPFTHALTHLDWHLQPVRWSLPQGFTESQIAALLAPLGSGRWIGISQALTLGLPAPLRRLLTSEPRSLSDLSI